MTLAIPEIDDEKCTGCGDCVILCPTRAVAIVAGKARVINPENCDYCTYCETICEEGAILCPFEIVLDNHL
ncbi:MAG: 4Fe-4S binding protein [Chloroflexi bacterium]|nr:4Fe-4S binding protein [Chloroflexota bacterium]